MFEVVDCGVSTSWSQGGLPCDQSHTTDGSPIVGGGMGSSIPSGVVGASVYVKGVFTDGSDSESEAWADVISR